MGARFGINDTWLRYRGTIGFTDINKTIVAGTYYVWGNTDLSDEERMGIVKNEAFHLEVIPFGDAIIHRLQAANSWNYIYQRSSINIEQLAWRTWVNFTVTQVSV